MLNGTVTLKSKKDEKTPYTLQSLIETSNAVQDGAYITTESFGENDYIGNGDFENAVTPTPETPTSNGSNAVISPETTRSNSSGLSSQGGSAAQLSDPSNFTTAQIIATARDAVNKTKAHKGNLKVNHTEGFTANVTECSGGPIVKSVVDLMIGMVVKPVDETLNFQNGKTVNSEGETIPILLPKKGNFTLSESGVKSASIQRSGNEYVIKIKLVEERVGMYDVPTHNAASVGYLDVANFDLSFMEIDSANIVYKGSSLELRINADGYVTYANYKIPLHIDGSAHKGSISGSASFEGEQTEVWKFNW